MPETYSSGESTWQDGTTELPWGSISFDWPIEIVVTEAEVVVSREPGALEWIVVRILQEFADQPPTLTEAAVELGINDPVFLVKTLKSLSASGLIRTQDPKADLSFANCTLTEAAQAFLEQGQLSSTPERHGLRLHLDMITGEHIPQPPRYQRQEPKNPIIAIDALPPRRTALGLDRARELARDQEEPFLTAGTKITGVAVQDEEGSIVWRPYDVTVSIDGTGVIKCPLPGSTELQQQWLQRLDLRHAEFDRLFSSSASKPYVHWLPPAKRHTEWRSSVERLMNPAEVVPQACSLIRSARQEIVAHAYWLTLPDIQRELSLIGGQVIRKIAFAPQSQATKVMAALSDATQIQYGPATGAYEQVALLADGSRGVSIDQVQLRSPGNRELDVIAASSLKPSRVRQLRQELPVTTGRD